MWPSTAVLRQAVVYPDGVVEAPVTIMAREFAAIREWEGDAEDDGEEEDDSAADTFMTSKRACANSICEDDGRNAQATGSVFGRGGGHSLAGGGRRANYSGVPVVVQRERARGTGKGARAGVLDGRVGSAAEETTTLLSLREDTKRFVFKG